MLLQTEQDSLEIQSDQYNESNCHKQIVCYTNTAIKSQPVVYQGKWEGKWNSTDGDSYNKKTTIYIRDLYGDGIDTNGSSFTEAEKAQFNWKGLRVQAYFSTFDAPKDSDGYNLIDANANFTPLENICVHSDDVEKLTSGTITDINGKEIPVSVDKPVWAISLTAGYKSTRTVITLYMFTIRPDIGLNSCWIPKHLR